MNDFLSDLIRLGKKIIDASEALQMEIDKHSPVQAAESSRSSSESKASGDGVSRGGKPRYSHRYEDHLRNGCPDPLKLLTVAEAEELMDCTIATPSTTGEEEYIGCHYGCADDRSMYVALTVSALMPWDVVTSGASSQQASQVVGDEALVVGDTIYVRQGEQFFWVYGRGVDECVIYEIAKHVAGKLAA